MSVYLSYLPGMQIVSFLTLYYVKEFFVIISKMERFSE